MAWPHLSSFVFNSEGIFFSIWNIRNHLPSPPIPAPGQIPAEGSVSGKNVSKLQGQPCRDFPSPNSPSSERLCCGTFPVPTISTLDHLGVDFWPFWNLPRCSSLLVVISLGPGAFQHLLTPISALLGFQPWGFAVPMVLTSMKVFAKESRTCGLDVHPQHSPCAPHSQLNCKIFKKERNQSISLALA